MSPAAHCEVTRHSRSATLPRHRHADAYVAVVLTGGYIEAGDRGRWRAGPGTAIVHQPYEAHHNLFDARETRVLNLPVVVGSACETGVVDDVDAIMRMAERDALAAGMMVAAQLRPGADRLRDWPDLLADALADNPAMSIAEWARCMGLAPASVSRGFARTFGTTPKRFRLEARLRTALAALSATGEPLAQVAAAHGFADQAHMTRAMSTIIGQTPAALRAKSVQ